VPGSAYSRAHGINDSGQIVGFYNDGPQNHYYGYLLSGGSYTTLDRPGYVATVAYGINASGQIVGYCLLEMGGLGQEHGFLLSGGNYTTIDFPGAHVLSHANGINASGQIVGTYSGTHGYLLSGGSYTTIEPPGSCCSEAHGINDSGQIVGLYYDGRGEHGYLLSGGSYTTLDVPGSTYTSAFGINDSGQIVGDYIGADRQEHGFLLSGGSYTTLDVPGSFYTAPSGINDAGQIVGHYSDSEGGLPSYGVLANPLTTWANPAGGQWGVASNWDAGRVPGPGDDVTIGPLNQGAAVTHGSGADTVYSLTSRGDVVVSGGSSLTVSTSYVQASGSLILAGGTLGAGLLDLQGGVLGGSGAINGNLRNAAVVSPGTATATGVLTINGDYTQAATGTLDLRIGGPTAGSDYDQLVVNGFATFDGTLDLHLVNGFQPQPGDPFQVLLFAQGQGTFSTYTGDVSGFSFLYVYDDGGFLPPGLTLVAN
jgi:uncharacterized membrane protein